MTETDRRNAEEVQSYTDPEPEVTPEMETALDRVIEETQSNPSWEDFGPVNLDKRASFDTSTTYGQNLLWIAANGKHMDLQEAAGLRLRVRHWIALRKEVTYADGKADPQGMTVTLFLDNDESVSWASPTTNRQWAYVVRAKGIGPYDPPLEIVITPNRSKNHKQGYWYSILPAKKEEDETDRLTGEDSTGDD